MTLDANTSGIIRWAPQKSQQVLRKTLINCLEDPHTILRRRLRGVKNTAKNRLKVELEHLQDHEITRSNLQHLAERHIPNRCKAFMREVNLLYYVIGSGKNLKPHLNPQLFSDLNRGYIESADISNQSFLFDELLQNSLKEMFVPIELIDRMSISRLASFREKYAKVLLKFRSKWWRTITIQGEYNSVATFSQSVPLVKEIETLLTEAVNSEKKALSRYNKVTKWLGITSLIMSGASLIPHPVLSALSFLVAASAYGASQDEIKHSTLKTDFAALTTCLRRHIDHKFRT